jgi:uncharacterized protein YukE
VELPGRPAGNVDHLRGGAAAWEHLAWQIWSIHRQLDQRVRTLLEGWSGPGADAFEKRWTGVAQGFPELDHHLHTVADRLRLIAFAIHDGQEEYDQTLAEAVLVGMAGVALTVLTVGGSDLVAGGAEAALAASLAGRLTELGITLSGLGALLREVAEALGNLTSRFAVDLAIRGPQLAYGPAGGAAVGVGLSLASGARDPFDIAAGAIAGAAENAGVRGGRGAGDEEIETAAPPRLPKRGDTAPERQVLREAEAPSGERLTHFDVHAMRSMRKRGWTVEEVNQLIAHPARIVRVRDTHWLQGGRRVDEPATAFIDDRGNYVIRNDINGYLVQVSRKDDPGWKGPFHGS